MSTEIEIAKNVKYYMLKQGLTQSDLARLLNYERTTVSKHLKNGIKSTNTIAEYASALAVPFSTLLPDTLQEKDWEVIDKNDTLGIEIGIRPLKEKKV